MERNILSCLLDILCVKMIRMKCVLYGEWNAFDIFHISTGFWLLTLFLSLSQAYVSYYWEQKKPTHPIIFKWKYLQKCIHQHEKHVCFALSHKFREENQNPTNENKQMTWIYQFWVVQEQHTLTDYTFKTRNNRKNGQRTQPN